MNKLAISKTYQYTNNILGSVTFFSFVSLLGVQSASALNCNGQFQVTRADGEISTPYCEDNYLATVARSYGWKVSNKTVRDNPSVKSRICRHIGHDHRIQFLCDQNDHPDDMHGDNYETSR